MNLRGLANSVSSTVNPNVTIRLYRSTGFTIGAGQRQVPSYAAPVDGPGQVQALDADDIAQISGLNIQGAVRAVYLYGPLAGVLRPDQTGGDKMEVPIGGQTWLVVRVLETWSTWTKAAIVLQGD